MQGGLKFIFKIKQGLIFFEKLIAASSLLLLLILAIFQFFARNFFDLGYSQLDMIARHLILFIILMIFFFSFLGNVRKFP